MKNIQFLLFAALFTMVCSCTNPAEQAQSTPIDSTNVNGTAPATYGATPADTAYPKYEGQNDQGIRANNASAEDSMQGRK